MRRRLPAALRERDYARLITAIIAMGFAQQMVAVAVGWQVYGISRNPLHLGLVGLAEFLPLPLLALPSGAIADRLSRKLVLIVALAFDAAIAGLLIVVSLGGADTLWPFLALAFASGCAAALGNPAARSMPPTLVPLHLLTSALAIRSTVGQATVVTGPAIGGLLFSIQPELAYATGAALFLVAIVAVSTIRPRAIEQAPELVAGTRLTALFAGLRFVRRTPVLLGAISLDLVAVLFGGAVALLPLFARDILEVGPVGLGILRSAPAVGALVAGIMLTRRPLGERAGRTLLIVVAVFGGSMVVFGLSSSFALSFGALVGERLRRHDQHEHSRDDHRPRDARRRPRTRQCRRDGLHQRLQRARRLRIRGGGCARRRRAGRRDRGDDHDPLRLPLAAHLPRYRPHRPPRVAARDRRNVTANWRYTGLAGL